MKLDLVSGGFGPIAARLVSDLSTMIFHHTMVEYHDIIAA